MNEETIRRLGPLGGLIDSPAHDSDMYLPYEQLMTELNDGQYMDTRDPQYYHVFTFWVTWHDPDYGSNQAVFYTLAELCDWITECGGFAGDDLTIVEEISAVVRG